jgi:hypothetical protein
MLSIETMLRNSTTITAVMTTIVVGMGYDSGSITPGEDRPHG